MENQTQIGYAFFKAAAGVEAPTAAPKVTPSVDQSAAGRGAQHGGTSPLVLRSAENKVPKDEAQLLAKAKQHLRFDVAPLGYKQVAEKAMKDGEPALKRYQDIAAGLNAANDAETARKRLYTGAVGAGLGGLAGGLLGYGVKKRKGALLGGLLGVGAGGLAGVYQTQDMPRVTEQDVMRAESGINMPKKSNRTGPMAPFSNRRQMADMNAGNLGKKLDGGLGLAQPQARQPQSAVSLFKANLRDAYGLGPAKPAAPVQPEATKSSAQVQAEAWMAREQKLASIIGQLKLSQYDFQGSTTGPAAAGPSAAAQSAASKPGLVSRAGKGLVSLAKRHPYGAAAAGVATIAAPALYAYSHRSTSAKPWEGRSPVTAPHVQTYGEEFNGKRPDGMPAPQDNKAFNEQNRQGGGAWDWIQNNPGTAAIGASGAAALAYLLSQRQQKEDE